MNVGDGNAIKFYQLNQNLSQKANPTLSVPITGAVVSKCIEPCLAAPSTSSIAVHVLVEVLRVIFTVSQS